MDKIDEYLDLHFDAFIEQLKDYLRIPSISTLSSHAADMQRAATWTADHMKGVGLSTVTIHETSGHPIVYGEWLGAPGAPTVLIYGHYDVQPVEPLDEWTGDPFEPVIRNQAIVARGAADDKGQVFINLKALQVLRETGDGAFPLNVKFLVEGEEEIGSANLAQFVEEYYEQLAPDVIVISDTTMLSLKQPAISTSFRGNVYVELEVRGPAFDLHSGQHGGVVHNPIQALSEIIAALHNQDGSISVPGFYDKVRPIDPDESKELAALYNEAEFRDETGAPQSWGEPQFNLRERIVARPTLELCGIVGGWTGEGRKTVLPSKAVAKISCRLVADQDPDEIEQLLRARIAELAPPTVTTEVRHLGKSYPTFIPTDNPAIRAAVKAYERGFGKEPIFMRKGGSLPILGTFRNVMKVPIVLAGYGLPSDRVHGPDEKFDLACLERGIATAATLYQELGRLSPADLTV